MESGVKPWLCWRRTFKLVSLLHSEHFVQSGRPLRQRTNSWVFGKEDKPVFCRKGLLFPGSGCSQLLGLLGWLWRRNWSQNANHWLAQTSTIRPQGVHRKVNRSAPFQILEEEQSCQRGSRGKKCVGEGEKEILIPCFSSLKNKEILRRGLTCHYQDWCGWQPYSFRGGLLSPEPEQAGENHALTELQGFSMWAGHRLLYSDCALHFHWSILYSRLFALMPNSRNAVENAVIRKEQFLLNVRNFGIVGTNVSLWVVGPQNGSQFGLAPDDFSFS